MVSEPGRSTFRCALAAALTVLGLPLWAQSAAAPASGGGGAIYSCIDDKGRRITADRPIVDCNAREQRVLNRDGSVRGVHPPSMTADERAEIEAREQRQALARAAQADAARRDRNLAARYPNEARHRKDREAALDTVRIAMKISTERMRDLDAERKPLLAEAEFYKGKPLPPKLRGALDANDASVEAQRAAILNQEAELDRINRLYDIELERLRRLWAGAAPGSLGPLQPAPGASAAAKR